MATAVTPAGSQRGPSRVSTLVHLLAAAGLVIALVPLVLRAAQAAPPAVAEFAPQVQQTIKNAPPGQGAALGGSGGYATPTPSPTPTPAPGAAGATATPTPVVVPPGSRVNKCVGNPPRQIEDPQSPPCVPFWDPSKSNGGATSFGVTATTIYVAVPQYTLTNAGDTGTFVNFFNDRFEFYGRKIKLVPFPDAGQIATPDAMRGDAQKVETIPGGAFAEVTYPLQDGSEGIFYDALATQPHPVISVEGMLESLPFSDSAHLQAMHPYEWNYVETPDVIERNVAEVYCRQLMGHAPSHAGSPTNLMATRKIGVIKELHTGYPEIDASVLLNSLQSCTGSAVEVETFDGYSNSTAANAATALQHLNQNQVTTVICLCHTDVWDQWVGPAAKGQAYYPEWLMSNIGGQDGNESLLLGQPDEAAHVIAIRSKNKELPTLQMPYAQAIHYESATNPKQPYTNNPWDDWVYTSLLVLASGIQMAGPDLTPQTFASALQSTTFPNPGCDGPPYYQACVGFQGGSHTMQQSFTEVWWNVNQPNPDNTNETQGAYCYVDGGARHTLGSYPPTDHFQDASKPCM